METLLQDIRYGWRMLAKSPGFTVVAVLTLAIGIGANTAIFSVMNAAMFHALPYRDPARLVHLWETRPSHEFVQMEASRPNFLEWQESNHVFSGLAGYTGVDLSLTGHGTPARIYGARVTSNFFEVLGVQPVLGRTFLPGEDRTGGERIAMLAYGTWQSQFGGDPKIVGQAITLSGNPYTVVGVLPREFQFAKRAEAQVWVPLNPAGDLGVQYPGEADRRTFHWINMIARLRPDVTLAQAQGEMTRLAQRLATQYPASNAGGDVRVLPLHEEIVGPVQPVLFALMGAVGLVLLIACVNVANLLLARATTRQKEIAVRVALGATRWRLLRQVLTESTILALGGGVLGVLWAKWGVDLLLASVPGQLMARMPYLRGLTLNLEVLEFTLIVSFLTGIVFGLVPALQASHLDLQETLKEGARAAGGGTHHRVRNALVVSEIALSLVLLTGAGLLLKSLVRLLDVNPGFETQNLLAMMVSAPTSRYADQKHNEVFVRELLERVQRLPGVRGAGLIDVTPLNGGGTTGFTVVGRPAPLPGQAPEANTRDASPNYFSVMGIPLIRGRFFTEYDKADAPLVLIINKTLADKLFPGEDAVGHRFLFAFDSHPQTAEIVGVVGDEQLGSLDQPVTPVLYSSSFQSNDTDVTLLVRAASDPASITSTVRAEVANLDPNILVGSAVTIRKIIADSPSVFLRRFPALLIGVFALLAVLLSAVGIYGVLSYLVTQRTREIGVRMALGARPGHVLRMLMGEGLRLAGIGIGVGLIAAAAVTRLLSGLLFGVVPTDATVFLAVPGLIALVTLAACWIPARRATKVDPMVALRYE
jgi:putative ABC transport system permease protein